MIVFFFLLYFSIVINSFEAEYQGCSLEVVVDPFLMRHWTKKNYVRYHVIEEIRQHVNFANIILKKTPLNPSIQLFIIRIKILDFENCVWKNVNYCISELRNSSDFLNLHSSGNHSDVCLSYVFTYRNFEDGALGLAWKAQTTNYQSGICAQFKQSAIENNIQSLNTGLITFTHNFNDIPNEISQISFIHEIGHSFGSEHDSSPECINSDVNGRYLMHPRAAVDSVQIFLHPEFSKCSIISISTNLNTLLTKTNTTCFTKIPQSLCGNGIVEHWEECDCGENELDCLLDNCCFPGNLPGYGCSLRPNSSCSPSEGLCCTSFQCKITENGYRCHNSSDCQQYSECNGISPKCPITTNIKDGSECFGGSKMCKDGQCRDSICVKHDLIPCFPVEGSNCKVHCRSKYSEQCFSSDSIFPRPIHFPINSGCTLDMSNGNESSNLGFCSLNGVCETYVEEENSQLIVGIVSFLISYLFLITTAICIYFKYYYRKPDND